jgi:hypothetical protein
LLNIETVFKRVSAFSECEVRKSLTCISEGISLQSPTPNTENIERWKIH